MLQVQQGFQGVVICIIHQHNTFLSKASAEIIKATLKDELQINLNADPSKIWTNRHSLKICTTSYKQHKPFNLIRWILVLKIFSRPKQSMNQPGKQINIQNTIITCTNYRTVRTGHITCSIRTEHRFQCSSAASVPPSNVLPNVNTQVLQGNKGTPPFFPIQNTGMSFVCQHSAFPSLT